MDKQKIISKFIAKIFYIFIFIIILIILICDKINAKYTQSEYKYRMLYSLSPKLYDISDKSLFRNCVNNPKTKYISFCISYDWTGEICRTKIYDENCIVTECKLIEMEDIKNE